MFDGILGGITKAIGSISGGDWLRAGGSLLSGFMGREGQEETNEQQIALAREQMDFQRDMSSSAYQRAVTDMKKAGLSPMLAYQQGGASTPGGAMPVIGNKTAAGMSSAATAAAIGNTVADTGVKRSQIDLNRNLAEQAREQAMLLNTQNINTGQQTVNLKQQIEVMEKTIDKLQAERDNIRTETERRAFDVKYLMPAQLQLMRLEAQHSRYGLSSAKKTSEMYERTGGSLIPYIPFFSGAARGASSFGLRMRD